MNHARRRQSISLTSGKPMPSSMVLDFFTTSCLHFTGRFDYCVHILAKNRDGISDESVIVVIVLREEERGGAVHWSRVERGGVGSGGATGVVAVDPVSETHAPRKHRPEGRDQVKEGYGQQGAVVGRNEPIGQCLAVTYTCQSPCCQTSVNQLIIHHQFVSSFSHYQRHYLAILFKLSHAQHSWKNKQANQIFSRLVWNVLARCRWTETPTWLPSLPVRIGERCHTLMDP